MSLKRKLINRAKKEYLKEINNHREKKGYFKAIPQQEAYFYEDKIDMDMKKHYCERKAYSQLNYFPNLDNPQSLNEKIIWLALNYKNPLIARCTDKGEFKGYIKETVGEKYQVPLIGLYDNVNDIDFDALPDTFVAKSTAGWGSKQVVVVKDKSKEDLEKLKANMALWLYPWSTYYYNNMCITDERFKPRILIEESIVENGQLPTDCKIYCCNGKAKWALVVTGRNSSQQRRSFVNLDTWKVMPFQRKGIQNAEEVERPEYMDEVLEVSEKLAKGIPFVRVDFYVCDNRFYVGEMTFSPGMFLKIEPIEWDYKLGELVEIPR